jgi:NAD(P)H-hydrate epimerase
MTILLSFEKALNHLKPRAPDSHKGLFGHVMILAGGRGMAGAAVLAAQAAARVGAGLISLLTHPHHASYINLRQPEVMSYGLESPEQMALILEKATVLVIGPGLINDDWSQAMLDVALKSSLPTVADAGAFYPIHYKKLSCNNWILCPHPGEAARLLDCSVAHIQADRVKASQSLQKIYGGIIVLKGHRSLIATENQIFECPYGNPGMASGGMGDLLSGIMGGLIAQHLDLEQAACLAVSLHAKAGDLVAKEKGEIGLLASDLLPSLQKLINKKA